MAKEEREKKGKRKAEKETEGQRKKLGRKSAKKIEGTSERSTKDLYADSRGSAASQFARTFLNINALHSSRVDSFDKRTKGQLFGGRKRQPVEPAAETRHAAWDEVAIFRRLLAD